MHATDQSASRPDALNAWIAACLEEDLSLPEASLPLDAAEREGVLPWIAWRLRKTGALERLPAGQQEELRQALRRWALMHLDSEAELERLAVSAAERGIRFLAFKGHSVARTLYSHPACRPTSDFDLLVDPAQVDAAQAWLADEGYAPLQKFVGRLWLGAQSWSSDGSGSARFHVDLHWDYTNRMYFRNRLRFGVIWAASREVACGGAVLRVPCPADELILACVHLAAHDPGFPLVRRWFLDVYLLMRAIAAEDIPALLQRAGEARAIEACCEFGRQAAEPGGRAAVEPVLSALCAAFRLRRARAFARTLRWRAWDLGAYWLRLPVRGKLAFFGDMWRWTREH